MARYDDVRTLSVDEILSIRKIRYRGGVTPTGPAPDGSEHPATKPRDLTKTTLDIHVTPPNGLRIPNVDATVYGKPDKDKMFISKSASQRRRERKRKQMRLLLAVNDALREENERLKQQLS